MIDACKRASARSITAVSDQLGKETLNPGSTHLKILPLAHQVIPYYGYARADRKSHGRESIAAKLTANLLTEASTLAPGCIHDGLLNFAAVRPKTVSGSLHDSADGLPCSLEQTGCWQWTCTQGSVSGTSTFRCVSTEMHTCAVQACALFRHGITCRACS